MRRRMPKGDEGAYAILYGLLLVVVLGTAAIVVDLAAMREDRRSSRLASDAAAVSGARFLDPLTTVDPQAACVEALGYVEDNLGLTTPFPTTPCATFAGLTCATSELTATSTSGGVTVTVTWPVLQGSLLLTNPDVQGGQGAQAIDTDVDGAADTACQRIGVTVSQIHEQFLAGLFGASDTATTVTSVARAAVVPGGPAAIAALNVLNETTCESVLTSGQGFIQVNGVVDDDGEEYPGIISIESDGRESDGDCHPNRPYVLNAADNASGAYVRADKPGTGGEGQGVILMYALNASPKGNPGEAYDAALIPPNTLLRPKPTTLTFRTGDSPVRDVYDCTSPCDDYPESYADLLKTKMQTGTPQPYPYAETPYDTLAFSTLSATVAPGFACTIGPTASVLVPAGNWYVDCPTLTVRGTLVFAGGTIVTRGGINVQGCLAVNTPTTGTTTPSCPTVVSGDTSPPAVKGAILYMRGGSFAKGANGHVLMPRTFVYMNSGALDFVGGPSGLVYWTNPRQSDLLCTTDLCQTQRFSKLALWNENANTQSLGGQSSLTVRGVVFVPEAKFTYTGEASQNQTNAQFWADTIEVGGQSGLVMAPDPSDTIPTPALGVVLIR